MIAPLSWLKDYVDIDITPQELQDKLFSCGFEVEELYKAGNILRCAKSPVAPNKTKDRSCITCISESSSSEFSILFSSIRLSLFISDSLLLLQLVFVKNYAVDL